MNDYELIYLIQEQNEVAEKLLYQKYAYLINSLLNKKIFYIRQLNIDYKDIYNACLYSFNNAIKKYDANANASFKTFASNVIQNSIKNYLYDYNRKNINLLDIYDVLVNSYLSDTSLDPLNIIRKNEQNIELYQKILKVLSPFEAKVYNLLTKGFSYQQIAQVLNKTPKQIDNAIQRMKIKIRNVGLSNISYKVTTNQL